MTEGIDGAAPLAFPERSARNRLLATLDRQDRAALERHGEAVRLERGQVLFDVGDDVEWSYFPSSGAVASLVLLLADGRTVEAATIGWEGAVGGIVSGGRKPAFARALVQIGGAALRVPAARLEELKARSPSVRDLFSRYADVLLAQVMQSVACSTFHSLEARCCRWLLTTHDRVGEDQIALTQEALSEMLGVQRTTVSAIAGALQARGLIGYGRGRITVVDRPGLERAACECYASVERHFAAVLPELVAAPAAVAGLPQ